MAPPIKSETYWTDMALLSEAGIPGVIWGPKVGGAMPVDFTACSTTRLTKG
jgi:hypothetical protein